MERQLKCEKKICRLEESNAHICETLMQYIDKQV